MPKIIITPWRDASELVEVRSQFYPSSSSSSSSPDVRDLRPDACRTVEAWKLRGHLPHAVEATALLTDAILHDDAERNSVFAIRATYAAAFSRFVTGLVDTKLGGQRGTMFSRASMIGLPLSFVELRHEAAHRELPSLVLLRNYTNRALEWLWNYYWAKIDSPSPMSKARDDDLKGGLRIRVKDILQQQQQQQVQSLQSDSSAAPPRKRPRVSATLPLAQSLSSICRNHFEGAQVLSRVLLEEGFLIPKDRQLGTSMGKSFVTWDYTLQTISDSYQPFLTILTEEMAKTLDKTSSTLPSTSSSSSSSTTTEDPYAEGVYLWLEHIITSDTWQQERLLLGSVSYIRTLCQESPNHWTSRLEKLLLLLDTP